MAPAPIYVAVVGSFPPPVNGQSKNLRRIFDDISRLSGTDARRYNVAAGNLRKSIGTHGRKFWRVSKAIAALVANAFRSYNSRCLYLVSDGGWGLVYTVALAWTGHALGYRVILQHRTFQYVRRTSRLAALADRALANGFHVFLCEAMALQYRARYESRTPYLVVGNLSQYIDYLDYPAPEPRTPDAPVTIGLLSNLYRTKGLDTFLEVAKRALSKNLPVRFVLAGPVPDADSQSLIHIATDELGDALEIRGPLYGADKASFFAELDIFMFPTRFALEAQPNVVLEAMCVGCAVISTDRGCISSDVADGGAIISCEQQANPDAYVAQIERLIGDRGALDAARARAHRLAQLGIVRDRAAYKEFLKAFGSGPTAPALQTYAHSVHSEQ